ncbi:hypothetical protein BS50DRAFT_581186 [Corynespora cassiicola Philippines]|uniref:F-box domain-containing protein n=1 Tax=Corynespora cassiicola Philippines TaxID=1448308 RepID=A0A2T2P9P9_CORCC|nr:hypothetical protein BS50DRAFT_581186 [Corynespora cassiicola Philippines]
MFEGTVVGRKFADFIEVPEAAEMMLGTFWANYVTEDHVMNLPRSIDYLLSQIDSDFQSHLLSQAESKSKRTRRPKRDPKSKDAVGYYNDQSKYERYCHIVAPYLRSIIPVVQEEVPDCMPIAEEGYLGCLCDDCFAQPENPYPPYCEKKLSFGTQEQWERTWPYTKLFWDIEAIEFGDDFKVTSDHITAIASAHPPLHHSLQSIACSHVDGPKLTDDDVTKLALACPMLENIHLVSATNLTNKSLDALLTYCRATRSITIAGDENLHGRLTAETLERLLGEHATYGAKLRYLCLTNQPILAECARNISSQRPRLEIWHGYPLGSDTKLEVPNESAEFGAYRGWFQGREIDHEEVGYERVNHEGHHEQDHHEEVNYVKLDYEEESDQEELNYGKEVDYEEFDIGAET